MDNGKWTIDNYCVGVADYFNKSLEAIPSLSIVNYQLSI